MRHIMDSILISLCLCIAMKFVSVSVVGTSTLASEHSLLIILVGQVEPVRQVSFTVDFQHGSGATTLHGRH